MPARSLTFLPTFPMLPAHLVFFLVVILGLGKSHLFHDCSPGMETTNIERLEGRPGDPIARKRLRNIHGPQSLLLGQVVQFNPFKAFEVRFGRFDPILVSNHPRRYAWLDSSPLALPPSGPALLELMLASWQDLRGRSSSVTLVSFSRPRLLGLNAHVRLPAYHPAKVQCELKGI